MAINYNLKKYIGDGIFIETGTGRAGNGITAAIEAGFTKIISIEITPEFHERAKVKFSDYIESGKVILLLGDSSKMLPKVLEEFKNERFTFWLDAHIDGPYLPEYKGQKCPLYDELNIIKNLDRNDHIIMIDDRRIFHDNEKRKGVNGWGNEVTETEIRMRLTDINPNYKIVYENGYIDDDVIIAIK
jgi:hypothetical protein